MFTLIDRGSVVHMHIYFLTSLHSQSTIKWAQFMATNESVTSELSATKQPWLTFYCHAFLWWWSIFNLKQQLFCYLKLFNNFFFLLFVVLCYCGIVGLQSSCIFYCLVFVVWLYSYTSVCIFVCAYVRLLIKCY